MLWINININSSLAEGFSCLDNNQLNCIDSGVVPSVCRCPSYPATLSVPGRGHVGYVYHISYCTVYRCYKTEVVSVSGSVFVWVMKKGLALHSKITSFSLPRLYLIGRPIVYGDSCQIDKELYCPVFSLLSSNCGSSSI